MKSIETIWTIVIATFMALATISAIWTPVSFSPFKIAYAKNVDPSATPLDTLSTPVSLPPQAKLVYNNQKYDMSPFIFIDGRQLNKVIFPPLPEDTNAQLTVQPGDTISFEFSKQPTKIDAFIIDYDGDIPSVHPLKEVGPSSFQISGALGIWDIEIHAIFPNSQYMSFTALANVQGNNNFVASQSPGPQTSCATQNRLQIAGVTESNNDNNNNTNTLVNALNNGNNTPTTAMWSAAGNASWIQLDLGQEKSICSVELGFVNGDKAINFFTIQTSTDGVHFVNHGSAQNTGIISGTEQFDLLGTPIPARFVKLTFQGNTLADHYNITNLKVIGS